MKPGDFGCVVLDLDGTLYHAGKPLPGAAEAVARLRAAGLPVRFLTNTFSTPPEAVEARLRGFGLEVRSGELFTPHRAIAAHLGERLAAKPALRVHAFLNDATRAFMDYLPATVEEAPDLLLVGDADERWSYGALDRLLGFLLGGAEFVASSPATTFVGRDGRPHLDTGALVALLEAASGKRARAMGKPSPELSRLVARGAGVPEESLLFVGDDPAVDMAAARAVGARSILVETGKGAAAPRIPPPDAVIPSLAALPAFLGLA
ncbi:MAG: HAD-IIA family hydrolase [Spirochaetaceae bacterium]|nr:HAD-IIA family hydrolase [Spirochaetaceae bacterium]